MVLQRQFHAVRNRFYGRVREARLSQAAKEVLAIEALDGDTDFAKIKPLVAGVRGREEVLVGGDIDGGVWAAGMVLGLIDDIPTCNALLKRIVSEAREAAETRLNALLE